MRPFFLNDCRMALKTVMEMELQKTCGAEGMCSDNYNLLFYRDCFTKIHGCIN